MSINSAGKPWPQTLAHDDLEWPTDDQRVLVPFHEAVNLTETGLLGGSIAFGTGGELYLLHTVDPEAMPNRGAIREHSKLKLNVREEFDVPVIDTEREYSSGVLDSFVRSHSITTTVVDEAESSFFTHVGERERVAKDCHTVIGTGMNDFESPSSILVPVASGPHSGLATKVAQSIAKAYDCWMELFHVISEDASTEQADDASDLLDAYEYRLDDSVDIDHHVYRATDTADAIVEHSGYHSLTILGAPQKGKLRRFLFGSTTDEVKDNIDHGPVLTAYRNLSESKISRWL